MAFLLSLRPHHARWGHVPQKALPCLGICFRGTAIQVPCSVTNAACDRAYYVVPLPTLLHEDKYLVLCVPLEVGALSALPLESHRCLTPGRCHVCAGLGHLGGPPRVSTLMGDGSGIPSSPHRGGAPGMGRSGVHGQDRWQGLRSLLLTAVIEKQREDSPRLCSFLLPEPLLACS